MSGEFGRGNEGVGRAPPATCVGAYGAASNVQRCWELGEYSLLYQQLVDFMTSVLDGDQLPFEIRSDRGRKIAVRNVAPRGLKNLTSYFDQCRTLMDLYWPDYAYTADFQLFFDCYREHLFGQWGLGRNPNALYANDLLEAEMFNDFVAYLRRQAIERGVRAKLWELRKRGVQYQYEAIDRWFEFDIPKGGRLLPVRVDLYYQEAAVTYQDAMPRTGWRLGAFGDWVQVPVAANAWGGMAEHRSRFDVRAALRDREAFFGSRNAELFNSLAGYVCKLEMGGDRHAYHFHALFLFYASPGYGVPHWVNLIDGHWRRVTGGQGLVYDCSARSDRHALEQRGLWALDSLVSGDAQQLAKLKHYVLNYFAKDEQMLRVKPTPKARTLTTGRIC
ncbi:hypothetical protein R77564_03697 [Ralstonia sp. LMG 32965]|uniref:Inovirus Gp2 family protein n=1 Tax=Ralstonia flatus TaxID=3058601 RepID=A0ABM9KZG9_9RALS|nr:hypothetical protein R77564_03697 [Ralstonia sp. LMG 32965]